MGGVLSCLFESGLGLGGISSERLIKTGRFLGLIGFGVTGCLCANV